MSDDLPDAAIEDMIQGAASGELVDYAKDAIVENGSGTVVGAIKPLTGAVRGLKESQSRHFDSFDKGTDFYRDALAGAKSEEERERIIRHHAEHHRLGFEIHKSNTTAWIRFGIIGIAVVALAVGGPAAAAQVMKSLK